MVSHLASSVKNVICIDLLNSSKEEIQNYCIIHSIAEITTAYLMFRFEQLHDNVTNEEEPHLIYLENNYIIGSSRHGKSLNTFQLGGQEVLPELNSTVVDKALFAQIEQELLVKKSLVLTPFLESLFRSAFKNPIQKHSYESQFFDTTIEINNGLAINCTELQNTFLVEPYFFKDEASFDYTAIRLSKIGYKNSCPLFFVFLAENNQSYCAWNLNYLKALSKVKPVGYLSVDKNTVLNIILDKINAEGLSSLYKEELQFLDTF